MADRFWGKFTRIAGRLGMLAALGLAACSGPAARGASAVETRGASTLAPAPAAAAISTPGATPVGASARPATVTPGQAGFAGKQTPTIEVPPPRDGETRPAGAAPFADCARTPGLVTCDPRAAALAGRLAFADPAAGRLIALDLQTGAGWQQQVGQDVPQRMEWSPDGQKLLVGHGQQDYLVFSAGGQALESFHSETLPIWQPDGSLSKDGTVTRADGAAARLALTPQQTWALYLKPAQGEERVLSLDPNPTDLLYNLRGWIPGTQKLLAQRYWASNSAMLLGGELLVLEPGEQTVAIHPLEVKAPLGSEAGLAWDPSHEGRLAFIASDGGEGARRLALWDATTNQVRYPLPEGVMTGWLRWGPAGSPRAGKLAFDALLAGPLGPPEAAQTFSGPGIYLLDALSGAVQNLVLSPSGAQDGWPHWTADGAALVYAREVKAAGGAAGSSQVRVRLEKNGRDGLLVQGLAGPEGAPFTTPWERLLAFGVK